MLERKAPLTGGIDTYIDMIEREMEGGVSVQLPWDELPDLFEHGEPSHAGGLIEAEEESDVDDLSDD
jgi:hypothetical protein